MKTVRQTESKQSSINDYQSKTGTDNQSILLIPRGNDVNSYIQKMKRRVIMQKHKLLHKYFLVWSNLPDDGHIR